MSRTLKQAVLFDFWQTLFSDDRERKTLSERLRLSEEFLKAKGIHCPEKLQEAFKSSGTWFFEVYHREQRTLTVEERLRWIFKHCGLEFEAHELDRLVDKTADSGILLDPSPTPGIRETLRELSKNYLLAIVSDTGFTPGRVLKKLLARHDVLDLFNAFSFSDETGHAKPHRKTFLTALDQLGVERSNAIHCGDLPDHDIIGANELGITSVLYTGCHQTELDGIKPDFTISDWGHLPDIVRQVFC